MKTITRNYPMIEAAQEAKEEMEESFAKGNNSEDFATYAKVEGPFKNDVEATSMAQYKLIITITEK